VPVGFDLPTLPEIPGDPAGMRALAASLRADAATTAMVAAGLKGQLDGLEFVGPAADRFFDATHASEARCVRTAERLVDTSALLERSATEVEAAQRERLRRLAEMRTEALEARREAMLP
jgi:uncharacterized protein YukE